MWLVPSSAEQLAGQIKLCKFAHYLIYTLPSIARMVSWSI